MNDKTIKDLLKEHYYAKHVYFYIDYELKYTDYVSGLDECVLKWVPKSVTYSSESLFFYMDESKDEAQVREWLQLK